MKITQSTKPVRVWTSRQYGLLVVSFSAFIEKKEGIFTCEFLQLEPGEWGYDKVLEKLIREKYSQSKVEALICNYLSEDGLKEHESEWKDFQEYRKKAKKEAKEIFEYGSKELHLAV